MDLLAQYSDSDGEEKPKATAKGSLPTGAAPKAVNRKPIVGVDDVAIMPVVDAAPNVDTLGMNIVAKWAYNTADKRILTNPTIEALSKPLQGPIPEGKLTLEETFNNHKMGRVEKAAMSKFAFDEQYLTFHNFGYAANPAKQFAEGDEVLVSTEANYQEGRGIWDKPRKRQRLEGPDMPDESGQGHPDSEKWGGFLDGEVVRKQLEVEVKAREEEVARRAEEEKAVEGVGIDDEQMTITTEDETGKRIVTKSRSLRALNEKGSNKVQLGILEEAAKQRMKSLLVEPEVLQLLWQHEEIFKGLNAAYADDRGHMSFAAVVQLCSDFSLAPKLISLHALRKIYESLEALDVDADEFRDSGSLDMMKAKSLNPTRVANGRGATRRSSIQQLSSSKPQAESSPTSLPRRSSLSLNGAKKRSTITTLDKKRSNMTSPVPSASTGASPNPSPVHSASLGRRRNSMQANFGTTSQERSGLMLPWEVISMRLREAAKNEPCSAFMRTPALMELLCKVAFSYLGCYGNMQQRSMSTVTQTVWLLVYMRFTVEHVRSTLQRRGRKEDHYGSLGRAVKRLRPEMWKLREAPEDQDNLPASVRPIPREVVRQTTKQAAEAPKEGTPYIADKLCVICKSVVEPGSWGNLRCFGCSKVDRTAFRRHPLVALLRCSGEKPVALAGKAPRVRNTSLSPVPFQENDILRPEENDLDVVNSRTSSPLRDGSFASSSQRS